MIPRNIIWTIGRLRIRVGRNAWHLIENGWYKVEKRYDYGVPSKALVVWYRGWGFELEWRLKKK